MASNDSLYGCMSTFPPPFDTEPPPIDDAESPVDTVPAVGATSFGNWCDFSGFPSSNHYQDDSFGSNFTFSANLDIGPPPLDIDDVNDSQQNDENSKTQLSKSNSLDLSPVESSADEFGAFDNVEGTCDTEVETKTNMQIDDFDENKENNEIPDSFDFFESATDDEIKRELNAPAFGAFDTGEPFLLVEKPVENISPASSDFGAFDEGGGTAMKFEVVSTPPSDDFGTFSDMEMSDIRFEEASVPADIFGAFNKMESLTLATEKFENENEAFGNFENSTVKTGVNELYNNFDVFNNAETSVDTEGNADTPNDLGMLDEENTLTSDNIGSPRLPLNDFKNVDDVESSTLNAKEIDTTVDGFGIFNEVETSDMKFEEANIPSQDFGAFDNMEGSENIRNECEEFGNLDQVPTSAMAIKDGANISSDDFGVFNDEEISTFASGKVESANNVFDMFNERETLTMDSEDNTNAPTDGFGAFGDVENTSDHFSMLNEVEPPALKFDDDTNVLSDDFGTFNFESSSQDTSNNFGTFNEVEASTKNFVDVNSSPPIDDFGDFGNVETSTLDTKEVEKTTDDFGMFNEVEASTGNFVDASSLPPTDDFGDYGNVETSTLDTKEVEKTTDDFGMFNEVEASTGNFVDASSSPPTDDFGDFGYVETSTIDTKEVEKTTDDFGMFNEVEASTGNFVDASSSPPTDDFGDFGNVETSTLDTKEVEKTTDDFGMFNEVEASTGNIVDASSSPPTDDFGDFGNVETSTLDTKEVEKTTDDFGIFNEVEVSTGNFVDASSSPPTDDFGGFGNAETSTLDTKEVDFSNFSNFEASATNDKKYETVALSDEFGAFRDFSSNSESSAKENVGDFCNFSESSGISSSIDFGAFDETQSSKENTSSGFGDFGPVTNSKEVEDSFNNFDNSDKVSQRNDDFSQFNSFESDVKSTSHGSDNQFSLSKCSTSGSSNQDNELVRCFNALNHCLPNKDSAGGAEKKVYDIIGHLTGFVKADEDVTLWQELNMSEDDSKYSLSYQGSNSFQSQIFSFSLDFKQISLSSEKASSILVPEQALNTPSKNTLLAQSLSKSLSSEKDFAALKGKDCSSGTPSETTSLDLEFFISSSQTSLPNNNQGSSTNLKEMKNSDIKSIEPQLVDLDINSSSTENNPTQNVDLSNHFHDIMSPNVDELSDQSIDSSTLHGDNTLTDAFEWGETVTEPPFTTTMKDINEFGNFASTADDCFDTSSIASSQSNADSIVTSLPNVEIAPPNSKLLNISSDADDSFSAFFNSDMGAPPADTLTVACGSFSNDLFGLKMDGRSKQTSIAFSDSTTSIANNPPSLTSDFSSLNSNKTRDTRTIPIDNSSAFASKPDSDQGSVDFACFESGMETAPSSNLASDDFGNFMSKPDLGASSDPIDDFSSLSSVIEKESGILTCSTKNSLSKQKSDDFAGFISNTMVDTEPSDDFASFTSNKESNSSDLPVNDFASFTSGTETNNSDQALDDFAGFTSSTVTDSIPKTEIITASIVADDNLGNFGSSTSGFTADDLAAFSTSMKGSIHVNNDFAEFSSNIQNTSYSTSVENDSSKPSSDDFVSFSSNKEINTSVSTINDFALSTSNTETNIHSLATNDFVSFTYNAEINSSDLPVNDFASFTSASETNISDQVLDDFAGFTSSTGKIISNVAADDFASFTSNVSTNPCSEPIDNFAAFSSVSDNTKESSDDFACFTSNTVPTLSNDFACFTSNTNTTTTDKPLDDFSSLSSIGNANLPLNDFSILNSNDTSRVATNQVPDDFACFTSNLEESQPTKMVDDFADFTSATETETVPAIRPLNDFNFPSLDSPKISNRSIDKFAAFTASASEKNTQRVSADQFSAFSLNRERDSSKPALDDFPCLESVPVTGFKTESEPFDKYDCFSAVADDNVPQQSIDITSTVTTLSSDFSSITSNNNTSVPPSIDFANFSEPVIPPASSVNPTFDYPMQSQDISSNTNVTNVMECTVQNESSDSFGDFAQIESSSDFNFPTTAKSEIPVSFPAFFSLPPAVFEQNKSTDLFTGSCSFPVAEKVDSKSDVVSGSSNVFAFPATSSSSKNNVLNKVASEDDVFSDFAESPRAPDFRVYSQLSGTSFDVDSCSSVSDFQFGNESESDFANFSEMKGVSSDAEFSDFQNFSSSMSGTSLPALTALGSSNEGSLDLTKSSSSTLLSGSDTSLDPSKSATNISSASSIDSMLKSPLFSDDLFKTPPAANPAVGTTNNVFQTSQIPDPAASASSDFGSFSSSLSEKDDSSSGFSEFADFSSFQGTSNVLSSSLPPLESSLPKQSFFNEQFSNMALTDTNLNMSQGMPGQNFQYQTPPAPPTSSAKDLESLSFGQMHANIPPRFPGMGDMYPQNNMIPQQQGFPNQQFNSQYYPSNQNQMVNTHMNFSNAGHQGMYPPNLSNTGQQGPGFAHVGQQGMVRGHPRQSQRFGYPQQRYPQQHNMVQFAQRPEQRRPRYQAQGGNDPFASFTIRSNAAKLDINLANRTLVSGVAKPKLNQIPTKSNPN